jgi:hypothetical protein
MSAAGERIFVKKIKREKSESAEAHVIADPLGTQFGGGSRGVPEYRGCPEVHGGPSRTELGSIH